MFEIIPMYLYIHMSGKLKSYSIFSFYLVNDRRKRFAKLIKNVFSSSVHFILFYVISIDIVTVQISLDFTYNKPVWIEYSAMRFTQSYKGSTINLSVRYYCYT